MALNFSPSASAKALGFLHPNRFTSSNWTPRAIGSWSGTIRRWIASSSRWSDAIGSRSTRRQKRWWCRLRFATITPVLPPQSARCPEVVHRWRCMRRNAQSHPARPASFTTAIWSWAAAGSRRTSDLKGIFAAQLHNRRRHLPQLNGGVRRVIDTKNSAVQSDEEADSAVQFVKTTRLGAIGVSDLSAAVG